MTNATRPPPDYAVGVFAPDSVSPMPNRLAEAVLAIPAAARREPGGLACLGTRGAGACGRSATVPILLSIGYSSCHWCHVMAHESFEDPATAAFMNEHFVNIKVDREERPDIDAIYMEAAQAMSGHGGWPLTAFLDADAGSVLRRHVLPAGAAPEHAELHAADGIDRRGLGEPARRDRRDAATS